MLGDPVDATDAICECHFAASVANPGEKEKGTRVPGLVAAATLNAVERLIHFCNGGAPGGGSRPSIHGFFQSD
jgi:hypothetical protein